MATPTTVAGGPGRRAVKPPFYENILVRHPVNPLTRLAPAKADALAQQEPCVVMGRGHSGTRLVAWICDALGFELGADPARHPSGDPADESFKHHLRVVASHSVSGEASGRVRARDLNRFQKAAYGFHRRLGGDVDRWGWKFPETYLLGAHVAATFPRARYLHLLRDGRDVAFKRHLTDAPEHRLARAILRRQNALALPHHLQAALSWAFQVERFEAFRRTMPPEQVLTIRYEELVRRPREVAGLICAFLGVPLTPACSRYVEGQISASREGEFRRQDARLVREVEERIGPTLEAMGYPSSLRDPAG